MQVLVSLAAWLKGSAPIICHYYRALGAQEMKICLWVSAPDFFCNAVCHKVHYLQFRTFSRFAQISCQYSYKTKKINQGEFAQNVLGGGTRKDVVTAEVLIGVQD